MNDIIGAKSIADGLFYRAKVIKKVNDVSYNVQFIDYGIEENVNLSEIVSLSDELKQVCNIISKVKNCVHKKIKLFLYFCNVIY